MRALIFLLSLSFGAAHAAEIKILKYSRKRSKAMIQLPKDFQVRKGQVLTVVDEDDSSSDNLTLAEKMTPGQYARNKRISVSLGYETDSSEVSVGSGGSSTTTDSQTLYANLLYGWNLGKFEYGGQLSFSSIAIDGGSTTGSIGLGGFAEFNFIENKPGVKMVPVVGGDLSYTTVTVEPDTGDSTATTGFTYGIYGGIKYFPWHDHLAFTAYLDFSGSSTENDSDPSTVVDTTELGVLLGMSIYY